MNESIGSRTEIKFLPDDIIELRYYDPPEDERYFSWTFPSAVLDDLVKWWEITSSRKIIYPLKERYGNCEINIHSSDTIYIKDFDGTGRSNMIGWSLPASVMGDLLSARTNKLS